MNQIEYDKLNKKLKRCSKCRLKKCAKRIVPGEGPIDAKIMLIGEAPGRQEDETGRPFVGRSGKLLTKLLEKAVGIKRKKVFITSVVKHRPPSDRKPIKKEIEACLPYLLKQIELINPKKIVLLGQTAFAAFFSGEKLSNYRGKMLKKDGRDFFITYHPAAGLRFQKMLKIIKADFRNLRKKLRN